jgi:hypothetical protein
MAGLQENQGLASAAAVKYDGRRQMRRRLERPGNQGQTTICRLDAEKRGLSLF